MWIVSNPKTTGSQLTIAPAIQTGAVLQVKYFQLTEPQTETYGTTDTDIAITNFNINITPKSTSSIIKLESNIMFEWANGPWDHIWFFLQKYYKIKCY